MDVSKNRGGSPKWMVKIMENPIKMDDLGGFSHYFWVDTHIKAYMSLVLQPPPFLHPGPGELSEGRSITGAATSLPQPRALWFGEC